MEKLLPVLCPVFKDPPSRTCGGNRASGKGSGFLRRRSSRETHHIYYAAKLLHCNKSTFHWRTKDPAANITPCCLAVHLVVHLIPSFSQTIVMSWLQLVMCVSVSFIYQGWVSCPHPHMPVSELFLSVLGHVMKMRHRRRWSLYLSIFRPGDLAAD